MKCLVVITGPTGVGKTKVAIDVARMLGCGIINADSRQISLAKFLTLAELPEAQQ